MALKLDGKTFNLGLSAFAGGAVALFLSAMPAYLFEELVAMSGISDVVAAAEPPLGTTARLAVSAFAGGVIFLLVLMLLRMLDPPAAAVAQAPASDFLDDDWEPARVRRADIHPDAPTRRPIFAGHEFGEPADLAFLSRTKDQPAWNEPAEISHVFDPDATLPAIAPAPASDGAIETPTVDVSDFHNPVVADSAVAEPKPLELVERVPLPEPLTATASGREIVIPEGEETEIGSSTQTLLARLPLPDITGESIASLLQRLDVGVSACEWPIASDASQAPEPVDERLRNVLEDLQKLAARS